MIPRLVVPMALQATMAAHALTSAALGVGAQELPPTPPPPRFEFGAALTMQAAPDVNRPPRCSALALPCESSRTLPDFGISATAAMDSYLPVGFAVETGLFANHWRADSTRSGERTNWVRFVMAGLSARTPIFRYGNPEPRFVRGHLRALGGALVRSLGAATRVLQVGAGADGLIRPDLWLRIQFDFRATESRPRELSGGRAAIGAVYTFTLP